MPTYDFRCTRCTAVFEAYRSFAEGADDVTCPSDGAAATRLFSPPMDLLVYHRRDPVMGAMKATVPPGGISCHDHGPDGSHSHNPSDDHGDEHVQGDDHAHSHAHGHSHSYGHHH
jgi:putative FmdB family regulatory protein